MSSYASNQDVARFFATHGSEVTQGRSAGYVITSLSHAP
jgi:hypothetical protein